MKLHSFFCALVLSSVSVALAVDTQRIVKDSYDEFSKGELRGLSVTEKGELRLAPAIKKLCDVSLPIIWAAGRDSKGNLYLAGGEGKVLKVNDEGKVSSFFSAKEQEIHALVIDAKDNLFVASSPSGKIYRISPDGKSSIFYDPPSKYVWAMAFDHDGNLFVACGNKAAVYKVSANGNGETYFSCDESNLVSLGFDREGRLLVGSEPGGYLYRLDGPQKAFVLYDSPLKELKAISTDDHGNIYALALGAEAEKAAPAASSGSSAMSAAMAMAMAARSEEKKPSGRQSELYRVHPDGFTETIWAGKENTIGYSLAVSPTDGILIGTGDKGIIYGLRHRESVSTLAKLEGQQVTALLPAGKEGWLAVTSNLGAVWTLSANGATEGSWESEAMDAKVFSSWGVVQVANNAGGDVKLSLRSRSGNTDKPEKTWSEWSEAERHGSEFALKSPAARYLQLRLTLSGADAARTFKIDRLTVYSTPRNLPPQFSKLTLHDPAVGFQKLPQPGAQPQIFMEGAGSGSRRDGGETVRPQQMMMVNQPGLRSITWSATDPNQDQLTYDVYLRAEADTHWQLMAEKITETFFTVDSRSFPDGRYRFKVVASDARSNPAGKSLTAQIESVLFPIDNTPPAVLVQSASAGKDGVLVVKFSVTDAMTPIASVEVSVSGRDWSPVFPEARQVGAREQEFTVRFSGTKNAFIRARDEVGNLGAARATAK